MDSTDGAHICAECLQSVGSLSLSHRVKCVRCVRPACKTPTCSATIPTVVSSDSTGTANAESNDCHVCQPCYRTWCQTVKDNIGAAACTFVSTIQPATTQFLNNFQYRPQPPDGFCVFSSAGECFPPVISHPTNIGISSTAVDPPLICRFILHQMTCAESPWWDRLRSDGFGEGSCHIIRAPTRAQLRTAVIVIWGYHVCMCM